MDAHLFRRLVRELVPLLAGARLARIQEPYKDVYTLSLDLFQRSSAQGRKVQLVLKCGRKEPFLFLSRSRISANQTPSAQVMRLRKYAGGRSIRHAQGLWLARELWLLMSGSMPAQFVAAKTAGRAAAGDKSDSGDEATRQAADDRLVWLVLSLRDGPRLKFAGQDDFPREAEPVWPALAGLQEALVNWQEWPVLTPSLRRALQGMDSHDAAALLIDLEAGEGDIFVYQAKAPAGPGSRIARISAWPLPCADSLEEVVREDVLQAFTDAGQDLVLENCALLDARRAALPWARKEKKLEERLELQKEDVERLTKMVKKRDTGLLLQANLWQLPQDSRLSSIVVTDATGTPVTVRLDPRYTLRENMERFFHTARRGARGLERVEERTRELEAELANARRQKETCLLGGVPAPREKRSEGKAPPLPNLPSSVQLFQSSDGFVLLRGRSSKGNQDARRISSPHDLWVHAEGGPGARVIIRRAHAAQVVPERTLDEAGALAAAKSWLKDDPRARINYCELRHVRPLKGAGQGAMRMDKILFTRTVAADPGLEERLSGKASANADPV